MTFKLMESLLRDLNEDGMRSPYVRGENSEPVEGQIKVYGNDSVVVGTKHVSRYNVHKDDSYDVRHAGFERYDVESISFLGQPVFLLSDDTVPSVFYDITGKSSDFANLQQSVNHTIDIMLQDNGREATEKRLAPYNKVLQDTPSLWTDIAKAVLKDYNSQQ